jgi:hypothetical protein
MLDNLVGLTLPAYRGTVTVGRNILATTEGVGVPRRSSNGENRIMSVLRHPLIATLLLKLVLQGNSTPQL